MVFPGVLRGLPGPRLAATPVSRPRRSLSSPGVSCTQQSRGFVSVATWGRRRSSTRPGWVRRRGSASGRAILARDLEPLAVRRDAERPFSVFMQRHAVGPIHLQRIRAEAHVAERTRATIRTADPGLVPPHAAAARELRRGAGRPIGRRRPRPARRVAVVEPVRDRGPRAVRGAHRGLPRQAAREGDRPLDGRAAGEHLRRRADRPQLPHRPVRQRPGRGRRRAGPFAPRARAPSS